jgi:hypothetical protein
MKNARYTVEYQPPISSSAMHSHYRSWRVYQTLPGVSQLKPSAQAV